MRDTKEEHKGEIRNTKEEYKRGIQRRNPKE
jgi:hypothetical protein